jgi:hypothetical protein
MKSIRYLVGMILTAGLVFSTMLACGEEFRVPDSQEISTYSPEALQLYSSGIRSLDRVDYINAYNYLAKAAQLQPNAVRLNMITAALAIKHGRNALANEAKAYYDTAIVSFRNVLQQPGLDDDYRRDVENRLKVATDERDNLAQRDVRREALGTEFIRELNREYASPTPSATAKPPAPVPAQPTSSIGQMYPGATPVVPGVGLQPYPANIPTPAYPQNPGSPGIPGLPPAPGQPGLPGAAPPGQNGGPGSEVPLI